MAVHERIEINPTIVVGKPVLHGSRISAELILRKISEETDETALLLVADESCSFSLVVGLGKAGHDVMSIAETKCGAEEAQVIDFPNSQRR
jgi:hypothetical protein